MLKALHHQEDRQCQMTDAAVMITAILAMLYFKGNFRLASQYCCKPWVYSEYIELEPF